MRTTNLQRKRPAEVRAKISASMMGHRHSAETCRKISEAMKVAWGFAKSPDPDTVVEKNKMQPQEAA